MANQALEPTQPIPPGWSAQFGRWAKEILVMKYFRDRVVASLILAVIVWPFHSIAVPEGPSDLQIEERIARQNREAEERRSAPSIPSGSSRTTAGQAVQDTNWCFQDDTDNRLLDQPLDRGNCAALLVGGALVAYFSGNGEVASFVLSTRQNEWADSAVAFACSGGTTNNQIAVRLIQACQCHNTGAQKAVESNQTEVLRALRARGGC